VRDCLLNFKIRDQKDNLAWFQLVYFDGQSLKTRFVGSVSLPLNSVVAGFRQAVIDANPALLSSMDAAQLRIYKNKTCFEGNEGPMEDDCVVSGLGLSDQDALVVLVSAATSSPKLQTKQHSSKRMWGFWALAFLFTHELDAVNCQEWRMLPLLNFLDDNAGYQVFTFLHVPIFAGILYGTHSSKNRDCILYRWSLFNVVHTGLHVLALWCPRNQFQSPLSWSLIIGGGICGFIHVYQNSSTSDRKFKLR
jgi:hypothetical protein